MAVKLIEIKFTGTQTKLLMFKKIKDIMNKKEQDSENPEMENTLEDAMEEQESTEAKEKKPKKKGKKAALELEAVSYTHLTLPTIYSV